MKSALKGNKNKQDDIRNSIYILVTWKEPGKNFDVFPLHNIVDIEIAIELAKKFRSSKAKSFNDLDPQLYDDILVKWKEGEAAAEAQLLKIGKCDAH